MEAVEKHTGKVYPLNRDNVDTDQIIPKQFLKRIERTGFGQFLFYNWRFDDEGNLKNDFDLDNEKYEGASVMVAGENFGCGSSREHAPWSLLDFGFKVIIAPSFADIFYSNAFKNGIIVIEADKDKVDEWQDKAQSGDFQLSVDLVEQTVTADGEVYKFDIPAYHKEKLINGWDDISLTLQLEDKINQFEESGRMGIS